MEPARDTVTLFIPVLNEIVGLKAIMPRIDPKWVDEIVFVDGGSTDGTWEWLQEQGYKALRQKSPGLCAAYWECLENSTGDILIAFSPDNNSVPELIPRLVAKMREGYDMVIASRYAGSAKSDDDDVVTAFGNWMFTKLINVLFSANYTDTLVMYRAFRRDLFTRLPLTEKKLPAIEAQMAIRCAKLGLRVADIPGDEPKRLGGVRKMRPLYNGSANLYLILKEAWRGDKL